LAPSLLIDPTHPRRILVVDDEPTIRGLIAEAMVDVGYRVDLASNGAEALERLRHAVPDAIVLDVMMPRLDGYGFVERLRAEPRFADIPIVVVTAAYAGKLIAEQMGADACLTKPFELDALLDAVEGAVSRAGAAAATV
jgi:CheY-like chemotaxis protein